MRITIELQPERDAEILAWLKGQHNWSKAIRDALRAHLGHSGVSLEDVYAAIRDLEARISSGARIDSTPKIEPGGDAPGTSEAAANLSQLGR